MTAVFVSAGPYSWGSSRMRAYWPAAYMQDVKIISVGNKEIDLAEDANGGAVIWQKQVDIKRMARLAAEGVLQWWDVCDPAWWWEPNASRLIADTVQGVVCSSEALAHDFIEWYMPFESESVTTKVHVIPDRVELSHFPLIRQHAPVHPVRLIWYGIGYNRVSMFAALANLERLVADGHQIELTICDDSPDTPFDVSNKFPIYQVRWSLERENEIIAAHDIAVLPPYPGAWGRVKSNNKKVTAAACGLPVVSGEHYTALRDMVSDTELRRRTAELEHETVIRSYDVRLSAAEWEELL